MNYNNNYFGQQNASAQGASILDVYYEFTFDKYNCPYGQTISVQVQGRDVDVLLPENIISGQTFEAPNMGNSDVYGNVGNLYITIYIEERTNNTMTPESFWRSNLGTLLNERKGCWGAYFPENTSMQMYANAIHNITGGRANQGEIIGILDYTSDFSIPCGAGIVITRDKMYIQLGSDTWGKANFLGNGIPVKEIAFDRLNNIAVQQKTFISFPKIVWQEMDGTSFEYKSVRQGKAFNYEMLVNVVQRYVYLLRGGI